MTIEKVKRGKIDETNMPPLQKHEVISDYRIAFKSRQASIIGRREVLSGKAKFGIFGDGKEVAQIAMAKAFKKGDFRSGYYRDQTFMLALGAHSIPEFFAQLFADTDLARDPATGGRSMNAHFATRSLDESGEWKDLTEIFNTASDISPTASQMPRLVGLAYASKLFRENQQLKALSEFSKNGDEVAFGTIGNASCAEGMFWESVNAIGVLGAPLVLSIWDDEYGISVSNEFQLTKDLSELLMGFSRTSQGEKGFDIYRVNGWDYPALVDTYQEATAIARKDHVPAIIHVVELTQPQGHSTSGSHERYKPPERLVWEREYDCLKKMREWILDRGYASVEELELWEEEDRIAVEAIRAEAWEDFLKPIRREVEEFGEMLDEMQTAGDFRDALDRIKETLASRTTPTRGDIMSAARDALMVLRSENHPSKRLLSDWKLKYEQANQDRYGSHLYSQSESSHLKITPVPPIYSQTSPTVNGYEIINKGFDAIFKRDARVVAFGEDVGILGGVNQGFAGLQKKYGELRVTDTGIREATIVGQAIGMAMRGLRPVAELQYLDYLLYALQIMSDDLATLHWRTKGGQKAPVIIRTRGHRLEGIWHSGSPMAGLINLVRGMHVLVPRNMVQAIGFYNTLLQADEPGVVVEVLNGYRLKEKLPDNLDQVTLPLGVPETLREGSDVTVVTYGPLCRIALEAADQLEKVGIQVELIDVQSLLPFDREGRIVESLKKTNRVLFLDEDVPGGATAYMMQEVLERQGGYYHLDSMPRTLSGQAHRPAYGSDGNYWSKPNLDSIFEAIYSIMHEADPHSFPLFL